MLQASYESNTTNKQESVDAVSNREEQAKKWHEDNRVAIEAYKAKQAAKGETFSQWADQI